MVEREDVKFIVAILVTIIVGGSLIGYIQLVQIPQYYQRTEAMTDNFSDFLEDNGVTVLGRIHMDSAYVEVESLSVFLDLAKDCGTAFFGRYAGFNRKCFIFIEGVWYAYELSKEEWLNK